jgi:hypothetical protein
MRLIKTLILLAVVLCPSVGWSAITRMGDTVIETSATASCEGIIRGGVYLQTINSTDSLTAYLDFDSLSTRAILGYQSVGAITNVGSTENGVVGSFFTSTTAGTFDTVTAYLNLTAGAVDPNMRAAVYLWHGNATNATLVDTSAMVDIDDETAPDGWYGFKMLNGGAVYVDSVYFLAVWSNSGLFAVSLVGDSGSSYASDSVLNDTRTYVAATWESPLTPPVTGTTARTRASIYATIIRSRTDSLKVKVGRYTWLGAGNNAILIDSSAQRTFAYNTADGWQGFEMTQWPIMFPDTFYVFAVWSNASVSADLYVRYNNASTGDTLAHKTVVYGAWPAPLAGTTLINSARMSIYGSYTSNDAASIGDTSSCFIVNDTLFATASHSIEDGIQCLKFTPVTTAPLKAIKVYIQSGSGGGTPTMRGAVYKLTDTTRVDTSSLISYNDADPDSHYVFLFVNQVTVTAGVDYYMCAWGSIGSYSQFVRTKTTGGAGKLSNSQVYSGAGWPATLDASLRNANYNVTMKVYFVCPGGVTGRPRKMKLSSLHKPYWTEAFSHFAEVKDGIEK